jgi:hypothetical protein
MIPWTTISVIVPTITGREYYLDRCREAYRKTTKWTEYEFIVLKNYPTCGMAWNVGIKQAKGAYIHLSADDLEPHFGWWQAAVQLVEQGVIPCPRILNSDGTLQSCGSDNTEQETGTPSDVARVPFLTREMAEALYPIFENQYCGDYWITREALRWGWPTVVVREMFFTHHRASEGRLYTLNEDWNDFQNHPHRGSRVSRNSSSV